MTAEQTARTYSRRPGFTLVSYGDVGLPVYRMSVRALMLEMKPIGPFAEFVLRSIATGIRTMPEIGSLLGVDGPVIEATTTALLDSTDLTFRPSTGSTTLLELTPKGKTTLETAEEISPRELDLGFDFDGLLREAVPFDDRLLQPYQIRERGAREISPSPTKPPEVPNLDPRAVERIARALGEDRRAARRQLIRVRSLRGRRRFYLPAVMLVYREIGAHNLRVSFAVDGQISSKHEEAFARSRSRRNVAELREDSGPQYLVKQLVGRDVSSVPIPTERSAQDSPDESETDSTATLISTSPDVHVVESWEHPALLERALIDSRQRLMILSTHLRQQVVTDDFMRQLRTLLDQNVAVFIGWGLGGRAGSSEIDATISEQLTSLVALYPNLHTQRLSQKVPNLLIVDTGIVVSTAFPWLSHRGDATRVFTDERGIVSIASDLVERTFAEASAHFASPHAS